VKKGLRRQGWTGLKEEKCGRMLRLVTWMGEQE
jgi:hypothetical protein